MMEKRIFTMPGAPVLAQTPAAGQAGTPAKRVYGTGASETEQNSAEIEQYVQAIRKIDEQITGLRNELNDLKVTPAKMDANEEDELEEAKLRAGAEAYMAENPDQANNWLLRADALSDKRRARLFVLEQQNNPNSPANVQKISTALNSLNYLMASPNFAAISGTPEGQSFRDRAAALQKQLSESALGSAFSGVGGEGAKNASSPAGLTDADKATYDRMAVHLDRNVKYDPASGVISNKPELMDYLLANNIDMNQNNPVVAAIKARLAAMQEASTGKVTGGRAAAEFGKSQEMKKAEEYEKWLSLNDVSVRKIESAVQAIGDAALSKSDPTNAAANLSLIDNFVRGAVGGKVTATQVNQIAYVSESLLARVTSALGFKGQTYSEKTIFDTVKTSIEQGYAALESLLNDAIKIGHMDWYDRFVSSRVAGPLKRQSSDIAVKFKTAAVGTAGGSTAGVGTAGVGTAGVGTAGGSTPNEKADLFFGE